MTEDYIARPLVMWIKHKLIFRCFLCGPLQGGEGEGGEKDREKIELEGEEGIEAEEKTALNHIALR